MILVAGSANLDFVVRAAHIPAPGETVLGEDFKTFPGGKGANQAVACARAGGAPTHMLLALGEDRFAAPIEKSLLEAGVGLHVIRDPIRPSGTAFICVSAEGENAITVAPGANLGLRPEHLPSLTGVSHLLLQLETPLETVTRYAQIARQSGVKVVLNAAPAQAIPPQLMASLDLLLVNEAELAVIANTSGSVAHNMLAIDVPCLVVTLGHRGCIARLNGQWLAQSAFAIRPVDTTAAGDTFCGALVAALALANGNDAPAELAQALHLASAAAALACTRPGAQSSIPLREEVERFLSQQARSPDVEKQALLQYAGVMPETGPVN